MLDQFENFIWGLDEARAALNNSTWSMNHGEGKNETVVFQWETQQDGTEALVGDANGAPRLLPPATWRTTLRPGH